MAAERIVKVSVMVTDPADGYTGLVSTDVTMKPPALLPYVPPPIVTGAGWHEPAGYLALPELTFAAPIAGSGESPWENGWSVQNKRTPPLVTRVAAPGLLPPYRGRFSYPQGFVAGAEPGVVFRPAGGAKSHYARYGFQYSTPYNNQIVGTKQWYPHSDTANYFVLFAHSGKVWIYVQAGAGYGGSYNLPGNVSDPTITLGVRHTIEVWQQYPSSAAAKDGIFRWWIDGVLCGDYTNIGWPVTSVYDEWKLAPTWGGMGGSVETASTWDVDHLYVSRAP